MLTKDDIYGVMPPLATAFTETEELNEVAFEQEVRFMLDAGVHGLVVGGGTGEATALTVEELGRVTTIAVTTAAERVPVIAGVLACSTREAIARGMAAKAAGAGALLVAPTIYGGTLSANRLRGYYRDVWDTVRLPIIVYNILPQFPVTPPLLEQLLELEAIIGVKEAPGGSLDTLQGLLHTVGTKVSIMCGLDAYVFFALILGARGSISSMNTILPRESVELWRAIERGDLTTARRIHLQFTALRRALGSDDWPVYMKEAINLQGRNVGRARAPFTTATHDERARLRTMLAAIDIGVSDDTP